MQQKNQTDRQEAGIEILTSNGRSSAEGYIPSKFEIVEVSVVNSWMLCCPQRYISNKSLLIKDIKQETQTTEVLYEGC